MQNKFLHRRSAGFPLLTADRASCFRPCNRKPTVHPERSNVESVKHTRDTATIRANQGMLVPFTLLTQLSSEKFSLSWYHDAPAGRASARLESHLAQSLAKRQDGSLTGHKWSLFEP